MTNPTLRDELLNLKRPDKFDTSDVVIEAKLGDIIQAVSRYVDAVKPEEAIPHLIQKEGQPAVDAIMQADAFNEAIAEYQAKLKEGLK